MFFFFQKNGILWETKFTLFKNRELPEIINHTNIALIPQYWDIVGKEICSFQEWIIDLLAFVMWPIKLLLKFLKIDLKEC